MKTIEIPLSKVKIVLLILGSIIFVALGVWLWSIADVQTRRPPIIAKMVGGACVIFFGACLGIGVKTFFDKRPGLIINEDGLQIFSSFSKSTFVSWEHITGMGEMIVHRTKLVLIFIDNVEEVIAAQQNKWSQKLMRANANMSGTPVSISSNVLKISHKELMNTLEKAIEDNAQTNTKPQIENF
ncbi:STM3941 family protein [Mucilaginibacter myungsuensis]|uniref:Uncharacterized protein n=1 Tax=Mucilaginibacter myungsuensis TaxID=649104 RepID=A0A929L6E7_9SPHI|nr:STM3941 family protein [Mucilaginibacter myungsuensis]MBE9664051.1 hypothetical protein [Mucilaginibacter myungsuensis]MDN3601229.1 STM3941 family protein [Mucilaginibacter myungsuensis]